MDEEETIYFVCPHCSTDLFIDDAGDLAIDELPPLEANQTRGIAGLKVQHSGASPDDLKMHNQQQRPQRESLLDIPYLGNHPKILSKEQEAADKKLQDANNKDLRSRSITPTTTTTNELTS